MIFQYQNLEGQNDNKFSVQKNLKPKNVTIVEDEANHNVSRFSKTSHHYLTMVDPLEACNLQPQSNEQLRCLLEGRSTTLCL